jgi:hypothetical protein
MLIEKRYLHAYCFDFFSSIYYRLMADRPTSGIASSSTSSTHTLSDSTMSSVDSVGISTHNPSSTLPPKPKKSEQTSIVWNILPK